MLLADTCSKARNFIKEIQLLWKLSYIMFSFQVKGIQTLYLSYILFIFGSKYM